MNINSEIPMGSIIEADLEIVMQGGGGSGGTANYNDLYNKPKINGVELEGDIDSKDLGITPIIPDNETVYIDEEGILHAQLKPSDRPIEGILFNGELAEVNTNNLAVINETDPNVHAWARSVSKPSYTAKEVDAVPNGAILGFEEIDNLFDAVFGTPESGSEDEDGE